MSLGRVLDKKNLLEEAIDSNQTALKLAKSADVHPDMATRINIQAHFYLGCQYEKKKELKTAIFHFKQVLLYD